MWNRIKRLFSAKSDSTDGRSQGGTDYEFKWYDPGDDNPFGIRVLDVRSLTCNVIAVTKDQRVAEMFNTQRQTLGREFISAKIGNSKSVACNLIFPHNGDRLQGVVAKADSMDVKWDIYIYDSVFLFVRSWSGELHYRAPAIIGQDSIIIHSIEASADSIDTAPQAVYFLLATHAMGRVLPHTIPRFTPDDPFKIAVLSFAMYGNRGCYATYEDITQIEIPHPKNRT